MRFDQLASLFRGEITGSLGAYGALVVTNGHTGQWTENAVHGSPVIAQAMQSFLDPPSIGFGHISLSRHEECR